MCICTFTHGYLVVWQPLFPVVWFSMGVSNGYDLNELVPVAIKHKIGIFLEQDVTNLIVPDRPGFGIFLYSCQSLVHRLLESLRGFHTSLPVVSVGVVILSLCRREKFDLSHD